MAKQAAIGPLQVRKVCMIQVMTKTKPFLSVCKEIFVTGKILKRKVIFYFGSENNFARNQLAKLFSELKLVTDNLLFSYAGAN